MRFCFFNGVYRSFLIFWKFINYCWFYRRDANWNHLYFSSPWDLIHHLEFLFGVCVCVEGETCMFYRILTSSQNHGCSVIPYALICDDIRNDRADGSGTPERCLQVFPERCRHEEESQRQGHQTLGHWPGHFLTNFWLLKLPYENAGQTMA